MEAGEAFHHRPGRRKREEGEGRKEQELRGWRGEDERETGVGEGKA